MDTRISVIIDAVKARLGARAVKGELDGISDKAKKTGKTMSDNLGDKGRLGRSISGLSALIAGAGIVGVLNRVIQATEAQQQALAQIDAALVSTGNAAGFTREQLQAMAAGFQRTTTYGDEAVLSMQAILLTFTKINETLPEASEAVLNVATRMGTDLKSAALQVGKALNDPIQGMTALTRSGIQFSDEQKELVKSLVEVGRVTDAQRVILQELEVQFGGSAKAARESLGGALQALSNAFGDLFEISNEGTADAVESINSLTEALSDPGIARSINSLVAGLFTILEVTTKIGAAAVNTATALGQLAGRAVAGPIETELNKVSTSLVEAREEAETLRNLLNSGITFAPGVRQEMEAQIALLEQEQMAAEGLQQELLDIRVGKIDKATIDQTISSVEADIADLRFQVEQFPMTLRIIGQLDDAKGELAALEALLIRLQERQDELNSGGGTGGGGAPTIEPPPTAGGGAKDEQDAIESLIASLDKQVQVLQEVGEVDKAIAEARIEAGRELTAVEEQRIRSLYEQKDALEDLATGKQTFESLRDGIIDQIIATQDLTEAQQFLADVQLGKYPELTAEQVAEIQRLLESKAAVEELTEAERARADAAKAAQDEIAGIIDSTLTESERIQQQIDRTQELIDGIKNGTIEVAEGVLPQLEDALVDLQGTLDDTNKKSQDSWIDMEEFAKEAARSIHGAFSDFFFDSMNGSFDDLAMNFKRTIDRMVADFLASQLTSLLFPGEGGGGDIFSKIGGALFGGGVGSNAAGGFIGAGEISRVNERGPEMLTVGSRDFLLMGDEGGMITPNERIGISDDRPISVNMTVVTPNADSFRKSSDQISADMAKVSSRALRRQG